MTDYINNICIEKETIYYYAWYNSIETYQYVFTTDETPNPSSFYYYYPSGIVQGTIRSYDSVNNTITVPIGREGTIYSRKSNSDRITFTYPKIPIGGDNFDDQWNTETFLILDSVTLSGDTRYTYSLESYLPDDDYDYEVLFLGCSTSTASSGKTCQLTLYTGVVSEQEQGWRLNRCTARTNATVRAGGCAIIPIFKSNRRIIVYTQDSTTNNTDTYLKAVGYRRIGRNKDFKVFSYLYCWGWRYYTESETPSVGDTVYDLIQNSIYTVEDCDGIWLTISYSNVTIQAKRQNSGDINTNYISNVNSYPIGGKNFDGEIVMFDTDQSGLSVGTRNANEHNILFDTTIAAEAHATFSVANVIPNDGYDYELCFSVYTATPSTSGKATNLQVVQGTYTTRPENAILVGYRVARTGAAYADFKTVWLPISASDKNITFFNITTATTINYNCMIHGYRRIGTND